MQGVPGRLCQKGGSDGTFTSGVPYILEGKIWIPETEFLGGISIVEISRRSFQKDDPRIQRKHSFSLTNGAECFFRHSESQAVQSALDRSDLFQSC